MRNLENKTRHFQEKNYFSKRNETFRNVARKRTKSMALGF